MPSESRNMPEQEHSIKVRSHELYVEDTPAGPAKATKPFPVYLRETPAQPLSSGVKAIFWTLGLMVALLFLAALWRVAQRYGSKPPPRGSAGKIAMMPGAGQGRGELAYLSLEGFPAGNRSRRTP